MTATVETGTTTALGEHPSLLSVAMTAIRLSVPWVARRPADQIYTLEEVSWHDTPENCWIIIYDRVYDITNFYKNHPGGAEVLLENAGRDGTVVFRGWGHGQEVLKYLQKYQVGKLPPHQCIYRTQHSVSMSLPD